MSKLQRYPYPRYSYSYPYPYKGLKVNLLWIWSTSRNGRSLEIRLRIPLRESFCLWYRFASYDKTGHKILTLNILNREQLRRAHFWHLLVFSVSNQMFSLKLEATRRNHRFKRQTFDPLINKKPFFNRKLYLMQRNVFCL